MFSGYNGSELCVQNCITCVFKTAKFLKEFITTFKKMTVIQYIEIQHERKKALYIDMRTNVKKLGKMLQVSQPKYPTMYFRQTLLLQPGAVYMAVSPACKTPR